MIRLFAAIPAPEDIARALAALAAGAPGARWNPPENLHITLRFAGEVSEDVAEDFAIALGAVSAPALRLTLAGVGAFARGEAVHAIWAGVEANEGLNILQRRCERAARQAGLKPETRAWTPHVTLAYLRGADPARVGAWIQRHSLLRLGPFAVDWFGLYSSRPTREGSVYQLERLYRLTPAPRDP
jgi:RNA 2',3'-cyclic 3'-phosphodiesterase